MISQCLADQLFTEAVVDLLATDKLLLNLVLRIEMVMATMWHTQRPLNTIPAEELHIIYF